MLQPFRLLRDHKQHLNKVKFMQWFFSFWQKLLSCLVINSPLGHRPTLFNHYYYLLTNYYYLIPSYPISCIPLWMLRSSLQPKRSPSTRPVRSPRRTLRCSARPGSRNSATWPCCWERSMTSLKAGEVCLTSVNSMHVCVCVGCGCWTVST